MIDSSDQDLPAKRRKVRKGTQSCWECKRRKIRCLFATPEDVTCIGCQRRKALCVSQELPEDLSPAKTGNRHLGERISKLEDFVKSIHASKDAGAAALMDGELSTVESSDYVVPSARPSDSPRSSIRAPLTPADTPEECASKSSLPIPASQGAKGHREVDAARHHLFAAFPAGKDANILLRESSRPSRYTYAINTQSHSRLTLESLASPCSLADLPGPNSHPVLLAKLMLIFAITLQSPSGEKCVELSEPQDVMMHRLMTAATTWVTTKDEMHETLEGLICIILEVAFEINCGNLRRAWVVNRRAMTVAQLMGLHRSPLRPLKRFDPDLDADPEFIWFRIVHIDRYLSLLLGLPQGTCDKSMGATLILRREPPIGRFERQLTVIASRILERNESAFAPNEITTTQLIDSELLAVSQRMPTGFWCPTNFQNLAPGSPGTLLETVRLSAQVYYYGLLIQLHLPYIMRVGDGSEHEWSKRVCFNASREIIMRFIAHRTFNPMSSCSRPVDFFALLAAMTLLLAHLDAHHHRQTTNFLAHQRLSDRAMLDQALERMNAISNLNKDVITDKSAVLIRRLLDIEADAAQGSCYTARSVKEDSDEQDGKRESEDLRLHIPYLGIVKITRQGPISREPGPGTAVLWPRLASQTECPQREPLVSFNDIFTSSNHMQSTDEPLPGQSYGIGHSSTFQGYQPASERPNLLTQAPGCEPVQLQCPGYSYDSTTLQPHAELPALAARIDDWAFQGVDMAFFDTMMTGTPGSYATGIEQSDMEDQPERANDHVR